ncbi:MAG: hypothetical protein GY810_08975 [Aureispira sp.]|nr:hypothetical protein [Aureispira sp.]
MKVYQYSWILILFLVACTDNQPKQDNTVVKLEVKDSVVTKLPKKRVERPAVMYTKPGQKGLAFDENLLKVLEKPYTIVDYFLLSPHIAWNGLELSTTEKKEFLAVYEEGQEADYTKKVSFDKMYFAIEALDNPNGYLTFSVLHEIENDADWGESAELTYWKKENGNILLAVNRTMQGTWSVGELSFFEFDGEKWTAPDFDLPEILAGDVFKEKTDNEYLPDFDEVFDSYLYNLPRKGKNIEVFVNIEPIEGDEANLKFKEFELVWKEEQFVIENKK